MFKPLNLKPDTLNPNSQTLNLDGISAGDDDQAALYYTTLEAGSSEVRVYG
jgi:hypothetical protein